MMPREACCSEWPSANGSPDRLGFRYARATAPIHNSYVFSTTYAVDAVGNIYGGSIGGSVIKDKSFFFNFEGSERRDGVTYSGDDVPHAIERAGDFSNRNNFELKDPLGGTFANNTIPQARMDPLGRRIADLYPDPNVSRAGTRDNRHWNTTTNWIHNFSPTIINEFRFNWGDRLHINRSAARFSGKNGEFGIPGVNPDSFARIGVNGLTNLVPGNQERIQNPIRTIEIVNNQTFVKGSHTVKWGFNWRYARNIDDQNNQTGGVFNFGNRATGAGIAELLLGHVGSASINDSDLLDRRTDYYGAFVQDDWHASSKLTLNFGLRWEVDTPL